MAKSRKSGKGKIEGVDLEDPEVRSRVLKILTKRLEDWSEWRQKYWEPRWLNSWRRLHNMYEKELSESEGVDWRSKLFFGATRQKTRVALSIIVENVLNQGRLPYDLSVTPVADSPDTQAFIEELKVDPSDRVENMRKYIDDQFTEAKLTQHLFAASSSITGLGTGVVKGPFVTYRTRNRWVPVVPPEILQQGEMTMQAAVQAVADTQRAIEAGMVPQDQAEAAMQAAQENVAAVQESIKQVYVENVKYELHQSEQAYPDSTVVDLWDFFPDPESEDIQRGRGLFERMVLTREDLAKLADEKDADGNPVYDVEAIQKVLGSPDTSDERYLMDQSKGTYLDRRGPHREDYSRMSQKFFAVMVYSGSLSLADMGSSKAVSDDAGKQVDRYKPHEVIAAFCNGKLIALMPNPYRRSRRPYHKSVFSRIPGCPFGWGIPDEMEHPQQAYNGFLRLFIDNKRLAGSVGFVIDENRIENPDEPLAPGFKFRVTNGADVRSAFTAITIPDIGNNLLEAMSYCERWGNAASGIPAYLDGDDTKSVANTAYEASEMKTSALKQLGMPIRYLDEGIIVPLVEMFYDWNMDHLKDPKVKGDFTIKATGYASFKDRTVKGIELRNLLALAATDPEVRDTISVSEIVMEIAHIGEIPEERFLRSEKERQAVAKQNADAAKEQAETQMQMELQKIQAEHLARMEELQFTYQHKDNALELRAADMQVKRDDRAQDRDLKARQFLVDQETKRLVASQRATAHDQTPETSEAPPAG